MDRPGWMGVVDVPWGMVLLGELRGAHAQRVFQREGLVWVTQGGRVWVTLQHGPPTGWANSALQMGLGT